MEDQLTIRLPHELSKTLKEKAMPMQRRPSEIVRTFGSIAFAAANISEFFPKYKPAFLKSPKA